MKGKKQTKGRTKGTGAIIKRNGHFFLRSTVNRKRLEKLLVNDDGEACTKKTDAEKAAKKQDLTLFKLDTQEKIVNKVAEIRQLKVVYQAKSTDVWQLYLNSSNRPDTGERVLEEQRTMFNRFGDWMQEHYHCGVDGVTPVAASEYMHEVGERVSNRTFNGYATILKLIYKTVYKQLGMTENPFEGIRHRLLETFSRKEFTEEEVQKIFDGFKDGFFYETEVEGLGPGRKRIREKKRLEYKPLYKDEMAVLMKLCCFSGCDGQSGCLMKWENIDLVKNQISYIRHKTRKKTNGHVTTLPIHPVLRASLQAAWDWREAESPYILPNVARRYQSNRCGVQKDAMKIIQCALGVETTTHDTEGSKRALGANVYSLHSFRHTFVSFCANAGVPLATVAEIVGHGSPMMTRHYSHINNEAKQNAISALPMLPEKQDADDVIDAEPISADNLRQRLISYINTATEEQLQVIAQNLPSTTPRLLA